MWYTITCPHCGRKFTFYTERDEYAAVDGLYPIIENHDVQFKHHDPALERKETEVRYWILKNMTKSLQKDAGAYQY